LNNEIPPGSFVRKKLNAGTAAVSYSPPPPRPFVTSWSTTPAASGAGGCQRPDLNKLDVMDVEMAGDEAAIGEV
jgi:hypothetical protein